MRTENRFSVYLQVIMFTAIFSAVGVLLVNSGVLASPSKQVPPIINNYYGIDCGTSDNPCYIRQVEGEVVTVDTQVLTDGACPNYPGGGFTFECNKPLNIQTIPHTSVEITTTVPVTMTDVPRTWGDGDSFLLLCLLVAVMAKFMILVIADIAEKNIFVWIYRTLVTGIWVAVDVLILYPASLRSLDIAIYGLWLAVWIFLMILDRAIDFFKHLSSGR